MVCNGSDDSKDFDDFNGIRKTPTKSGQHHPISSNAGVSSNKYSSSSDVDRGDMACMAMLVPAGHAQNLGLLLVPELQKCCAALTSTPSCLM
ncbi:hypothetical protein Q3G72_032698 [Acer saccharum]|nr:hypothetical protein Q3G72_032698 [Acer saccharum]